MSSKFTSPSGRYVIEIVSDGIRSSRAEIRLTKTAAIIAVVNRNFGAFPLLWIEDYNSHDYLVCGEDYQGQTVLELDTGARRDYLPEAAKQGHGFCWAEMRFDPASKIITACGCVWACPYEYRFYDFTAPMEALPELTMTDEEYADGDDPRWPEITVGSVVTVECFQSEPPVGDEEEPVLPGPAAAIKTFHRDGAVLRFIGELVTEKERAARLSFEAARAAFDVAMKHWQATDPLYLAFRGFADALEKNKDHYDSRGVTHDRWCPFWTGNEGRWCRRIYGAQRSRNGVLRSETATTIDLEWAMETGPIKLTIYPLTAKDNSFDVYFTHSVDGMREAFAYAARWANTDRTKAAEFIRQEFTGERSWSNLIRTVMHKADT
jgi:hypothetical protein